MSEPTKYPTLRYQDVEASLPSPSAVDVPIAALKGRGTLVVLDDDPTGTQTVHDITVLTTFDKDVLVEQFGTGEAGFFVLTNSRAWPDNEVRPRFTTLLENIHAAAKETRTKIEIVLRSDSTLRGHFPLEDNLTDEVFGPYDAWVLAPSFFDDGRVTIDSVHYARDPSDDRTLVPVGEIPSAADKSFEFKSSNLSEWIAEKYGPDDAPNVVKISVDEWRATHAGEKIAERLRGIKAEGKKSVIVSDTFTSSDMDAFVAAIGLVPEIKLLYRTGASFVSSRLGIVKKTLIQPKSLFGDSKSEPKIGGLTVIGSCSQRTTAQREYLLSHCKSHIVHFEIDVAQLLGDHDSNQDHHDLVEWIARNIDGVMESGLDAVVSTSRELITNDEGKESLLLGSIVTGVLVNIVKAVDVPPRYIIAKGGITSSDIATDALGMKKATVVGQAAMGVPIWRDEWTSIPYIVFPGSVGTPETLGDLVSAYRAIE